MRRARTARWGGLVALLAGCAAAQPQPPAAAPAPRESACMQMERRLGRMEQRLHDLDVQLQLARHAQARSDGPQAPASLPVVRLQPGRTEAQAAEPLRVAATAHGRAEAGAQLLAQGTAALQHGELSAAQGPLERALAQAPVGSPLAARALLTLADVAIEQQAYEVALMHLRRFLTQHPGDGRRHEARLRMALAHEGLASYREARAILLTIVKEHPHTTSAQVARVHLAARAARSTRP